MVEAKNPLQNQVFLPNKNKPSGHHHSTRFSFDKREEHKESSKEQKDPKGLKEQMLRSCDVSPVASGRRTIPLRQSVFRIQDGSPKFTNPSYADFSSSKEKLLAQVALAREI